MDVFEFRRKLVREYEVFTRSFCRIRSQDIQTFADSAYQNERFWPDPLIQMNPGFVSNTTVSKLVAEGHLHPLCDRIFRIKNEDGTGSTLSLYHHQEEAIKRAAQGKSYIVSTGTGSGKSLAYFIPIVDAILKTKDLQKNGSVRKPSISAIVVYPMNALCNSQRDELEKFLAKGFPPGKMPVTFARYTGQESQEERAKIRESPPDILLTNFMMLEYLMTRQNPDDLAIVTASEGLRFLVMDELHSYRGRQGADVAMLIRRVKERFNPGLQCIGTSATMASEGSRQDRQSVVAQVGTRFFGIPLDSADIIFETLKRRTLDPGGLDPSKLRQCLTQVDDVTLSYDNIASFPLAQWVEENLGIEREGEYWIRSRPKRLQEAAKALATVTGLSESECREGLQTFLMRAYHIQDADGRPYFAFRLHQFFSGAGSLYATLEPEGSRYLTLDGQKFKPGDREKHLYEVVFCRECGQEYYPVWASRQGKKILGLASRDFMDRIPEEEDQTFGYFMPDPAGRWSLEQDGAFPDSWLTPTGELRSSLSKHVPQRVLVGPDGTLKDDGFSGWFIPGRFRFCLNRGSSECSAEFEGGAGNDFARLSPLSSEGRSSATTILVMKSLLLMRENRDLEPIARKILGFTDNRQDAALQAGHFNDLVQIVLIRSALLVALEEAGEAGMTEEFLAQKVFPYLRLLPEEFMSNPRAEYVAKQQAERAMRDVLGYRLILDLLRGWRFSNPNLEQLGLLEVTAPDLPKLAEDTLFWKEGDPRLAALLPEVRQEIASFILETMRRELCLKTMYLDSLEQERFYRASFTHLIEPWGFSPGEKNKMEKGRVMVLGARNKTRREDPPHIPLSARTRLGRKIKKRLEGTLGSLSDDAFYEILEAIFSVMERGGLVERDPALSDKKGYRVPAAALLWRKGALKDSAPSRPYDFFRDLYESVAELLKSGSALMSGIRAAEHTAQVEAKSREEREDAFKTAKLPVLFCSPTMELGVDISQLNYVYLRNVPPTPSNYAQRSGRSGRSGQPSLVVTYCASRSPHDQYFFQNPEKMVSGVVDPPLLDLTNEELLRSHLHAVWLAETGQQLDNSIANVLDREHPSLRLREDLAQSLDKDTARHRAIVRARSILKEISPLLIPSHAPWFSEDWGERVIHQAFRLFDKAFDRWRTLLVATLDQMKRTHAIIMNPVASQTERDLANSRYAEAKRQMDLLSSGTDMMNSDFYTYRYLANQGFLPGYNFPRLPLIAYIPGRREKQGQDTFLSRPRFLAIAEFGPNSLIYHEGAHYRVNRVLIGHREQGAGQDRLPTDTLDVCRRCGYAHFQHDGDPDRCLSCHEPLTTADKFRGLFRIENLATIRQDRITSDEEERRRQGFELLTTFQFSKTDRGVSLSQAEIFNGDGVIVGLRYSPASPIMRLNLGRRRRKNKGLYGFNIDLHSGRWQKESEEDRSPSDDADDEPFHSVMRIVPFVEDRKNLLILDVDPSWRQKLGEEGMVTLQYALKRGVETVFQVEESELAVDPLPRPDDRQSFLFYESAEGGAGILQQLVLSPERLRVVAREALTLIHCDETGQDREDDFSRDCEAGCYRCLLSYYNQPDHDMIDRKNPEVREILRHLSTASVRQSSQGILPQNHLAELLAQAGSSLEREWLEMLDQANLLLPDRAQPVLKDFPTRPDFLYERTQTLIYIDGPHHQSSHRTTLDAALTRSLEEAGYTVLRFALPSASWPSLCDQYPDVFGVRTPSERSVS